MFILIQINPLGLTLNHFPSPYAQKYYPHAVSASFVYPYAQEISKHTYLFVPQATAALLSLFSKPVTEMQRLYSSSGTYWSVAYPVQAMVYLDQPAFPVYWFVSPQYMFLSVYAYISLYEQQNGQKR